MIWNILYLILISAAFPGWLVFCGIMLMRLCDFLLILLNPDVSKMLSALNKLKQDAPGILSEVSARLAEDEFSKDGEIEGVRMIGELVSIDHERIRKSWLYRKAVCHVLRFENSPDYARIIGQEKKLFRLPCHTVLPVFSDPDANETVMLRTLDENVPCPESILDEITGIFFVKQIELKRKDEVNHGL